MAKKEQQHSDDQTMITTDSSKLVTHNDDKNIVKSENTLLCETIDTIVCWSCWILSYYNTNPRVHRYNCLTLGIETTFSTQLLINQQKFTSLGILALLQEALVIPLYYHQVSCYYFIFENDLFQNSQPNTIGWQGIKTE